MRLYTKTGASQVDDPEFGSFKADAVGAFDGLPDAMYAKLHGRPGWENDAERELRMASEELERFRDPASLLAAVKELSANQGVLATALAQALGLATPAAVVSPPPAPAASAVAPPPAPAPVVEPEVPAPTVKSAEASVEASPKVERAEEAAVDVEPEAKESAAPALAAVAPAETAVKPAAAVKATRARKSAASSAAPSA